MKKLLLVTISLFSTISASAATIYVDANGTGDYPTIQAAIDDSNDGDEIILKDGTYIGEGNRDIRIDNKSLTIRSLNGPNNCTIDCNKPSFPYHYAFYIEYANIEFEGLRIINAGPLESAISFQRSKVRIVNCHLANNDADSISGGAIDCSNAELQLINSILEQNNADEGGAVQASKSNVSIAHCIFSGNSAEDLGGAIHSFGDSIAIISDCTFNYNSAEGGGGISWINGTIELSNCTFNNNSADYAGAILLEYSNTSSIRDCTFNENSADGSSGGAINCLRNSPTIIQNCKFNNNYALRSGGAMSCREESNPTIQQCSFVENSAEIAGGGLFCYERSNPTIINSIFIANSANDGGGLYCYDGDVIILNNCSFIANYASIDGGAVLCDLECDLMTNKCTFSQNFANRGGAIYCQDGIEFSLTNSILWNNIAANGNEIALRSSVIDVSYCDIQKGETGIYNFARTSTINWGSGNIDADPCFVNPGYWDSNGTPADTNDDFWIDGDYRLLLQSLCINTGDPNYILDPNCPNDLDGNPRIVDGRIDMGAYEFPGMLGAKLFFVPRVLNTQSRRRTIVALLAMPQGILRSDINQSELLVFTPGNVIAQRQYVFQWKKHGRPCTWVMAVFNKSDCMPYLSPGQNQVEVTGKLNDGRYFFGNCNLRVNSPTPTRNRRHRRR